MWKPNVKQMSTPIKLQTRHETSINGSPDVFYADKSVNVAMCNWKGRGGSESVLSGTLVVDDTADITMWWRPDIWLGDRVILGESSYDVINIENVEMRNQFMILKVKRAVGA